MRLRIDPSQPPPRRLPIWGICGRGFDLFLGMSLAPGPRHYFASQASDREGHTQEYKVIHPLAGATADATAEPDAS